MNQNISLDQMVESYIKIRDAKQKASDLFKKDTERMNAAIAKLEGMILKSLNDIGAESVKTNFGTAFTKRRSSVSVRDRDKFYEWAVATGNLYAVDMKANAKNVRELLDEGVEVPGVNYVESTQIGVRRA